MTALEPSVRSTGEDWMSVTDACAYLGIQNRTLYRLMDQGQLPAYKFGRVYRLRRHEVDDFIDRCRVVPSTLTHLYPPRPADGGGAHKDDSEDEGRGGEGDVN